MTRTPRRFRTKAEARRHVWDHLQAEGAARFPFPPHGRIPNFAGARQAALRLLEEPPWRGARCLKVNPDAPQRPLREEALRRGIALLVPTPRLRSGFRLIDPREIPPDRLREAASLSKVRHWSREVPLDALPRVDAIVTGSVAVTRDGGRCGKGEGYSDLEYAVLRELGHPPLPVATTVHTLQVLEDFPRDPNDLPLSCIVTPEETIHVSQPPPPPEGIDWARLDAKALEAMPVLRALREALAGKGKARGKRRR